MKISATPVAALLSLCLFLPLHAGAADPEQAAPAKGTVTTVAPAVITPPAPAAAVAGDKKVPETTKTSQSITIGYVDLSRFSSETAFGRSAKTKIQEKGDALRSRITAKQKQLEKLKSSLEAKLPDLSPKERKIKGKEFEKKVDEYQTLVKNSENELQQMESELTRKLYDAIEQGATAYGKANGLAAVVIKKELLFVGSSVDTRDVTEEVLKQVEASAAKK